MLPHPIEEAEELKEYNQILVEFMEKLSPTDQEYKILGDLMVSAIDSLSTPINMTILENIRKWLAPSNVLPSLPMTKIQIDILSLTYDQLPLYINDEDRYIKVLATWRLKIGR